MPASQPSSSPPAWVLPVAAIAVTIAGLWWFSSGTTAPAPAPAPVAATQPAGESTAPATNPDGTPRKHLGMFAHADGDPNDPSTRKRRDDPDANDEDDLPLPAAPGKPKRHHRARKVDPATAGKRSQDRHTLFASEAATPYASGSQTTLDDVKGLTGEAGTVSFWILPVWAGHVQDDAALVTFGNDIIRIFKNVTFLRYEILDENGTVTGLGFPVGDWAPGEWHQVVATWDGRTMWFYVDGALINTTPQPGQIVLPEGTPIRIGSAFPANRPVATAVVANVQIRDRALNPTTVARRFMAGPPVAPAP